MKHLRHHFTLFAFALVLTGCASLATEPAQTFNQKFAYAIGIHTAILQATASAVTAGTISSKDAQAILTQADTIKVGLDAAEAANAAGDTAGANSKLAIALVGLQTLQDYLRSKGSKP